MSNLFNLYRNSWEYDNTLPDVFGRARQYNSQNSNVFTPVISNEMRSRGFRPHYPDGKKFAVCVSHDIDHLYLQQNAGRKLINAGKGFLKGRFGQGWGHLGSMVRDSVHNEYDLNNLIDINNRHKLRSTYYFLSLNRGEEDFNYHPGKIQDQIRAVVRNNNEIGLHGGHRAYNDFPKLMQEKKLLEESTGVKVYGYRNHYLRFELPTTWNNLQKGGFEYDTTLGYADTVGFRNGMCYPFLPYDVVNNRFLDIVELPLVIMDATLFFYMRMDFDIAFKICVQLIEKVIGCGGVLTLLWHNNFISGEMGAFYIKLLKFLQSADPWFATSLELVNWWKEEKLLKQSQEIIQDIFKAEITLQDKD